MKILNRLVSLFKRQPPVPEFGWELKQFAVPGYGAVEYAQWLHPSEEPKIPDAETIAFYGSFIKKGDFVIDIGAHTGDTTLPIALCCGKEGMVLALEPNPYVFKILKKNSGLNKALTNIMAVNVAATHEDGMFTFNYSDAAFCNGGFFDKIESREHGHHHRLRVKGVDLQKYLHNMPSLPAAKLSLIKIDAEGYDKEIIRSIAPVICRYRPVIITECHGNLSEGERFEMFELLHSFRYRLQQIDNFDSATIKEIATKEDMLNTPHFDIIARPL